MYGMACKQNRYVKNSMSFVIDNLTTLVVKPTTFSGHSRKITLERNHPES
jgi:hypothetical protein